MRTYQEHRQQIYIFRHISQLKSRSTISGERLIAYIHTHLYQVNTEDHYLDCSSYPSTHHHGAVRYHVFNKCNYLKNIRIWLRVGNKYTI